MSLQIRKISIPKKRSKKAISIMIGYVLLVSFAIIMSALIYTWLKTYTPSDKLECPGSTSLFITNIECNEIESSAQLNLTLKNNGKFDIGGYFIRATISANQNLAILDLSGTNVNATLNMTAGDGGLKLNPGVKYLRGDNPLKPGEERNNIFELYSQIYSIEIIPIRYQEERNKKRLVICGNSKLTQEIICG